MLCSCAVACRLACSTNLRTGLGRLSLAGTFLFVPCPSNHGVLIMTCQNLNLGKVLEAVLSRPLFVKVICRHLSMLWT